MWPQRYEGRDAASDCAACGAKLRKAMINHGEATAEGDVGCLA